MSATFLSRMSGLGALLSSMLVPATQTAGAAPKNSLSAVPDLNGVWVIKDESLDGRPYDAFSEVKKPGTVERPPHQLTIAERALVPLLTPAYRARHDSDLAEEAKGRTKDLQAACLPQGMPQLMYGPFAMEIMQTSHQINFFSEWMEQTRRIYLDRKEQPTDLDPTYNGHSIGHWEGDALVVDTVGIRAETELQGIGIHHSVKLHITERLHRVGADLLQDDMTMEDPEALVKPWHGQIVYRKKPDLEIMEYVCEENNKDH